MQTITRTRYAIRARSSRSALNASRRSCSGSEIAGSRSRHARAIAERAAARETAAAARRHHAGARCRPPTAAATRRIGKGCRPLRRAPCRAPTRARSTGQRARQHRVDPSSSEKRSHERGLTDAGRPGHINGRRPTATDGSKRPIQELELAFAANEWCLGRRLQRPVGPRRWIFSGAEPAERLTTRQAPRWIAAQQTAADRVQIGGHLRRQVRRRRRIDLAFEEQHFERIAFERKVPRQRFVERRPNAVPIADFGGASSRYFFGRYVAGVPPLICSAWPRRSGKSSVISPKSRITTRPDGVTITFDGLMSSMELAEPMQLRDAVDELPKRGHHAIHS